MALCKGTVLQYAPGKFIKTLKKIGEGGFGSVFLGRNHNSQIVVIKVDRREEDDTISKEEEVYKRLGKALGFPKRFLFGNFAGTDIIVLQHCGKSLHDMLKKSRHGVREVAAAEIGIKLIDRLEKLHTTGFLHRDLKPDNIMVDGKLPIDSSNQLRLKKAKIYLIDFGNVKNIGRNGTQIGHEGVYEPCAGTVTFATPNWHRSFAQSCRDDFIALAYVLAYICNLSLPWKGMPFRGSRDHENFARKKESISGSDLFPSSSSYFSVFYEFVDDLRHSQRIPYHILRFYLKRALKDSLDY